jgi:hypothetical protein
MKRLFIMFLLGFVISGYSVIYAQTTESGQADANDSQQNIITDAAEIEKMYWPESLFQNLSLDRSFFNGKDATGFHIRPAWRIGGFEGELDFAFYQNPWNDDQWQWGVPIPETKPIVPNFVDSLAYYSERLNLSYQKISDLNFGYGLLINAYHPTKPYHGWNILYTPLEATKLTYVAFQDIIYFEPFEKNDFASLRSIRLDQSFTTKGLNWQLGITNINDDYPNPSHSNFPTGGTEYDLTLTNLIWCSPFWEKTELDNLGYANMLGITGRLGLVSYQTGFFQTQGKFVANYFGAKYEDLKWNYGNNVKELGLTNIGSLEDETRNGFISKIRIEVSPWLNIGYLNITDTDNINIFSLSGSIERLGVAYGLYYIQLDDTVNYDWFFRGGNGFAGYGYHCYYDCKQNYHHEFEVNFKF